MKVFWRRKRQRADHTESLEQTRPGQAGNTIDGHERWPWWAPAHWAGDHAGRGDVSAGSTPGCDPSAGAPAPGSDFGSWGGGDAGGCDAGGGQ